MKRIGDEDYEKIYLYPNSHAGYYPGAKPIAMKVIFRKSNGRLLGAQALIGISEPQVNSPPCTVALQSLQHLPGRLAFLPYAREAPNVKEQRARYVIPLPALHAVENCSYLFR